MLPLETIGRGIVLGVSLGSLLGGSMLKSLVGPLGLITPWTLPDIVTLAVTGQPVAPMLELPIIFTAVWCVLFAAVAVWKFKHQEL